MTTVKVSSRFQIAVPAEARERLSIERGDRLIVEVRDEIVMLIPEPCDVVAQLRGLHKDNWDGVDAQDFVRREREAWTE